jgi:hypothetical protein
MKLANDWKEILKKAWSVRFMILAGVLSGVEVILPFFVYDIPRGTFAVLSFLAVGGAFISRIVAQRDFR